MKSIDFSILGGFPFCQDDIEFLQQGYTEVLLALAAAGGDLAGPLRISGLKVTEASPGVFDVSAGFFAYGGELLRMGAISGVAVGGGDVLLMEIVEVDTSLLYFDGTTNIVVKEKVGIIVAAPSVTDPTHFPVADLIPWGRERDWTDVAGTFTGTILGTAEIKRIDLINEVRMRALFAPGSCPVGGAYATAFTLPDGYRPLTTVYFVAPVAPSGVDTSGLDNIRRVNCKILTTGEVQVEWTETASGLPYQVQIDTRFPLD